MSRKNVQSIEENISDNFWSIDWFGIDTSSSSILGYFLKTKYWKAKHI